MTRPIQHRIPRQRGAVIVEMVLVTPILLLLMLGTAEITRAFVDHNTLTKAARNGARYVAANAYQGTTGLVSVSATLAAETSNLVVYGNTAGAGTPVLPGLTVADVTVTYIGGNNVEVVASHPISGMLGPVLSSFSAAPGINLVHTLQATVTMRAL